MAGAYHTTKSYYDGEYAGHEEDYKDLEASTQTRVADRRVEWEWIEKIECAVKVLSTASSEADGAVAAQKDKLEACMSKTVDTRSLTIVFPSAPVKQERQDTVRPCSQAYIQKFYSHLPSNAPAAPCTVNCEGRTTQKYSYLGCFASPGWTRPGGDVPSTIGGVEQCRRFVVTGDSSYLALNALTTLVKR